MASPEKKHNKEKITLSHQVSAAFKTISQMSNDFVVVWLFYAPVSEGGGGPSPFLSVCFFASMSFF